MIAGNEATGAREDVRRAEKDGVQTAANEDAQTVASIYIKSFFRLNKKVFFSSRER